MYTQRNQIPCGAREVLDFHKRKVEFFPAFTSIWIDAECETPRLARDLRKTTSGAAPNPVMRLWTGCTRLKTHLLTERGFSLTEKVEGVQQDCSLTAS
jgi:hypothetical protein